MSNLALAAAALGFPGVVLLCSAVLALRRRNPPVPFKDAAVFVCLGMCAVVLGEIWSLAAERWLLGRWNINFYYAFFTASMPEEGFRFLVVLYGLSRRPHVSLVTAMLLGSLVGLTFGTYEHLGYALTKGWWTWFARSFTSVPYHTLSGAVLGYAAATWLRKRDLRSLIWLVILIIVHGCADWPLLDVTRDESTTANSFLTSGWAGNIASLLAVAVMAAVAAMKAKRIENLESSETRRSYREDIDSTK
jgi:RsiW-degrading membrane proteinase PrsW (M82 family)